MPLLDELAVRGWKCLVCGAVVGIGEPTVFRCPNATSTDPYHSLTINQPEFMPRRVFESDNPFVAYQPYFAWDAFAAAMGMTVDERCELVERINAQVRDVAGVGFTITPFARADRLSDALGFDRAGGIWIKNETNQVGGSHKARHLFSTLLMLLVSEQRGLVAQRPPLAISSCGNAAIAAATLAAAVNWPILVFVPTFAGAAVVDQLRFLNAQVTFCPRRGSDAPGDPCVLRYREAVTQGAVPFSVQGPENAWCLDGGRTIGWEMSETAMDHLFVQVGGGAFARSVADGWSGPRLHAVQTAGCAPLQRAWVRARDGLGGFATAAARWAECMTPWETEPHSAADGILDDETYDWLGVVAACTSSGGAPVVASEQAVLQAAELARVTTDIDASITGTAGLAGLLAIRDQVGDSERVAIVFSGIRREPL